MANETTLVILGASGDLTSRLLLPALGQLFDKNHNLSVTLVGVGQDDWSDQKWRDVVTSSFTDAGYDDCAFAIAESRYRQVDITDSAEMGELLGTLSGPIVLYFAVPPRVAVLSCEALQSVDLPAGIMLALEKPFGTDEASARSLNETLASLVPENQVFRVDHFLGRSTLLNLLGLRFTNRIFDPLWNSNNIAQVNISYDESLGLEGRAGYYDTSGALDDMIQSHLLQVLAFVAMEPPATLGERDLRDATGAVLRATFVMNDDPIASSRRARYTAGTIGERTLPNYADEPGVDASRNTETLAEVAFEIRNARWAGVPFTLRSGKAMGDPRREIVVHFKPVSHVPDGFTGNAPGGVLRISLGPDTMQVELNANGGDDPFALHRIALSADLGAGDLKAYAEVLSELLEGDPALSVRGDAAEECWRIVAPVKQAWSDASVALQTYPAGTLDTEAWPATLPG